MILFLYHLPTAGDHYIPWLSKFWVPDSTSEIPNRDFETLISICIRILKSFVIIIEREFIENKLKFKNISDLSLKGPVSKVFVTNSVLFILNK